MWLERDNYIKLQEFQKVKDDFDEKHHFMENKILQTGQSTSTHMKNKFTESREDRGYPTEIKDFDGNQSWTMYHKPAAEQSSDAALHSNAQQHQNLNTILLRSNWTSGNAI